MNKLTKDLYLKKNFDFLMYIKNLLRYAKMKKITFSEI